MRIVLSIGALAIITLGVSGASAAGFRPFLAYPTATISGTTLAYRVEDGRISECRQVDALDTAAGDAACASLRNVGVPRGVEPAASGNNPDRWVTTDDLPRGVLARRQMRTSEILFEVGETGMVDQCWTIGSSGIALLDQLACRLVTARATFSAASYEGRSISAVSFVKIRWARPLDQ